MGFLFNSVRTNWQARLRRRQIRRLLLWVAAFAVLLMSYQLGKMHSNAVKTTDIHTIEELSTAKSDMEKQVVSLKADLLTTQTKLDKLTQQYDADVGDKDLLALNQLIHDRLDNGVTMERLKQVIAATSNIRNCSAPDTKRFIISTGTAVKGSVGKVSFGSGLIVITGEGATEVNARGGHETWYDPKQPVDITIAVNGGETVHKQGIMPIHYSVIQGGAEYRLTIAPGGRSYAEATADQCAYP